MEQTYRPKIGDFVRVDLKNDSEWTYGTVTGYDDKHNYWLIKTPRTEDISQIMLEELSPTTEAKYKLFLSYLKAYKALKGPEAYPEENKL